MIFWYSGCGNSRFVAEQLAAGLNQELIFIPEAERSGSEIEINGDEMVGFVFPIYAWAAPKLVTDFIAKIRFAKRPEYLFAAVTCGDETCYTYRTFSRFLQKQGVILDAFFSFKMPETYINLPGFKLDTPQSEKSKIDAVKEQLPDVITSISKRDRGNFDELKGGAPFLKSYILKPLFYGLLISDKPFNVNDSCNGCGKCAKECPLKNINMVEGRPVWNGNCTNCMSCYHHCPNNAINFGKQTCGKGQYYFNRPQATANEKRE